MVLFVLVQLVAELRFQEFSLVFAVGELGYIDLYVVLVTGKSGTGIVLMLCVCFVH